MLTDAEKISRKNGSRKKYRLIHLSHLLESEKKWRENHKEYKREYDKQYREKNKDKIKERKRQDYIKNPKRQLEANKRYFNKLGEFFNIDNDEYRWVHQSWSKTIKKRNNYICQVCSIKGDSKTIHAHHLLYKSKHPKLSLNINNGISLCLDCHQELHLLNGK